MGRIIIKWRVGKENVFYPDIWADWISKSTKEPQDMQHNSLMMWLYLEKTRGLEAESRKGYSWKT